MTSRDAVRQLKEIAVELTEMSAEEVEEIWPWVNGLVDAVDALRVGRRLKTYDETGGHSAGRDAPPLPNVPPKVPNEALVPIRIVNAGLHRLDDADLEILVKSMTALGSIGGIDPGSQLGREAFGLLAKMGVAPPERHRSRGT